MSKSFREYLNNINEVEGGDFNFNPVRKIKDKKTGEEKDSPQKIYSNVSNIKHAKTILDRLLKTPNLIKWLKDAARDGEKQLISRATSDDTKKVLTAIGIIMHVANVGKIGDQPIVGSPVTQKQAIELLAKIGITEEEINFGKKTRDNILKAGISFIADKEKEREKIDIKKTVPEPLAKEPAKETPDDEEEDDDEPEAEAEEDDEKIKKQIEKDSELESEKKDKKKLSDVQRNVAASSKQAISKWSNLVKFSSDPSKGDSEIQKYWKNVDDYIDRYFGPKDISKITPQEKTELDEMKKKAREKISASIRKKINDINELTEKALKTDSEVDDKILATRIDTYQVQVETLIYPDTLGRTLTGFRKIGRGIKRIARGIKKVVTADETKAIAKDISGKVKGTYEKVKSKIKSGLEAGKEAGQKAKIVRQFTSSKFKKYQELLKQGNTDAANQIYKHAQRMADIKSKKFLPSVKESFEITVSKAKAIRGTEIKLLKNIIRHRQ